MADTVEYVLLLPSQTPAQYLQRSTARPKDPSLRPSAEVSVYPSNSPSHSIPIFRLWAASGQAALEHSRILVLSASATSTSVLKNLVLPGIGHFTILDHSIVTPEDAGNNFFLQGPESIGKSRAEEAVRLLSELNEDVDGKADTRDVREVLEAGENTKEWLRQYTIVIVHNLDKGLLETLSRILWEDECMPSLLVVRSAGFLGEFSIQSHEHTSKWQTTHIPCSLMESPHSYRKPSGRIPFSSNR